MNDSRDPQVWVDLATEVANRLTESLQRIAAGMQEPGIPEGFEIENAIGKILAELTTLQQLRASVEALGVPPVPVAAYVEMTNHLYGITDAGERLMGAVLAENTDRTLQAYEDMRVAMDF